MSFKKGGLLAIATANIWAVQGATAADATDSGAGAPLEEIVITAQKRTEKLSDVPVSASVLSADALSRVNAGDITDLNNLVPSVDLIGTFNGDRKSTRLNSSHPSISYAVFCLKKKN